MYFFKEGSDLKDYNGVSEKDKFEKLRNEYNTVKKYIEKILDFDTSKYDRDYNEVKNFNLIKSILIELLDQKIKIQRDWIDNIIKEYMKINICYPSITTTYILDMLFEITKKKKYIEMQFRSEWDYPCGIYEVINPNIKQLVEENKELKKRIEELKIELNHYKFQPGGEGYLEAKHNFESLKN